jgi:quinolinate synthase
MDIVKEIQRLKKERNAVILVHNYQRPEVQDIADFLGDSLGLSIEASKTKADVIVFCGVYFMAETAKIISPDKTVLIPDKNAGCPMADMVTADDLRELKAKHPKAKVMCYVNTSAEVKAECDICCTSANSIRITQSAFKKDEEVIFVPDKYLADYTARQTKRDFIVWPGYCPTHAKILPEDIDRAKKAHPEALVLAHPECSRPVLEKSDAVLSTEGLCRFVKESKAKEFIVGTELDIIHRLKKENPDKQFYPVSDLAVCPNMKRITLEKVLSSLKENKYEVTLPADIIKKAARSIKAMLAIK